MPFIVIVIEQMIKFIFKTELEEIIQKCDVLETDKKDHNKNLQLQQIATNVKLTYDYGLHLHFLDKLKSPNTMHCSISLLKVKYQYTHLLCSTTQHICIMIMGHFLYLWTTLSYITK